MKIVLFTLFLLAMGLIFWGLNWIIRRLSYEPTKRYLHSRLILAIFLVMLAATNVYTFSYMLKAVDAVINAPQLANFYMTVLPNRAYELLYMLLSLLGVNLGMAVILIVTILVTKLIFRKKQQYLAIDDYIGFERILHLPWLITDKFYEERNDQPELNSLGFSIGIWAKGIKFAFLILTVCEVILFACSILWGTDDWNETMLLLAKSWYLLPAAGFLLTEQIQFFLEGETEEEAGTFGSTHISERLVGDMSSLLQIFRKTFDGSDALLYSQSGKTSDQSREGLSSNDLGNQQIKDCAQPDVLNVIVNQLQQGGVRQCDSYQNALVELLNGRCINICDNCEGEFLIYLTAYLNFHMAQGRTALILCKNREQADQMYHAIDDRMQRLNSLYRVWNISTVDDAECNNRMSILICSYDDFMDHHITSKRQDFVSDLFCTVITNGYDLFAQNSIRIERLFTELRLADTMQQYVIFTNENNDALRTAMERAIKTEILPFHNDTMHPNTNIMIWKEEGFYKLQRKLGIGNAMSPYMGTALPLALVAAKYDLPQAHVIPDLSRGDLTYHDVLTMSSKEAADYVGKNINLKSVIRYHAEEVLERRDLSMIVAYDTNYNFFNALWRWMKYGGQYGTLIHVVSPPYLLREYFAANFQKKNLLLKNNEFDAFIPYHLNMKISRMAVLLIGLCNHGMTEEALMEKSREYHWEYENVEQLLKDSLRIILNDEEIHNVYECFHFEEEKYFLEHQSGFAVQTRITLTDTTIRDRLRSSIGYVQLISKNDQQQTLPILRKNVRNYYLRGQILAHNGYLYKIRSVDPDAGKIYAEQTQPQDISSYYQITDFNFSDYQCIDNCVDYGYLDLNICTADVTRNIYGYWSGNQGTNFVNSGNIQVNDLQEIDGGYQQMHFDKVNILELNFRRSIFGDKAEEAVQLCAFILNDLFKTLFPMTYQNLFAAVSRPNDPDLIRRVLSQGEDAKLEDIVSSMIPGVDRCCQQDDFITLYVVEFSAIEYGMVQMLYSRFKQVLQIIQEYLRWYINDYKRPTEDDPSYHMHCYQGTYLHFGADEVPAVFDLEALLQLCDKLLPKTEEPPPIVEPDISDITQCCTFCGRQSLFTVELEDHRRMCSHCKDHQLTQKDEIKSMFADIYRFMQEGYGINLRKNIHVRFQSASAIAKETGGVTGGRILGFYNFGNHQLWLEARGPRVAMQSTLIHELTHAWQQVNLDMKQLLNRFPVTERDRLRLLLMEGHAVYVEIETMRKKNEEAYADRLQAITLQRDDEYGQGYRLLYDYIKSKEDEGSHMNPFTAMQQLVQEIIDGKVTIG